MTKPFVFSCDAHIAEPPNLYLERMPAHLQDWAINVEMKDDVQITKIGPNVVYKLKRDFHEHKVGQENAAQGQDSRRRGARDLKLRFIDMARDGVDAELVFPSMGLMAHRIDNTEAALETARIYNDWAWDFTAEVRDRLVPVAIIPVQNLDDGLAEFKRIAAKGYAAVMLPPVVPPGVPNYNEAVWDPIFAYAGEQEIPIIFHTGTGNVNIRALKGPGAALYNYARQMNDAVDVIAMLVGGGVLDRNPRAKIMFAEHGAGWVLALGERMDEVYVGHAPSIQPKLSRKPSQIVRDQVYMSFQNDIGCIALRKQMRVDSFLFATDYPHSEGTFPFSRDLMGTMFDNYPEISEEEKAAFLGGNAVKLFKRANISPAPLVAA